MIYGFDTCTISKMDIASSGSKGTIYKIKGGEHNFYFLLKTEAGKIE